VPTLSFMAPLSCRDAACRISSLYANFRTGGEFRSCE
jgi:hypothetical protein